MRYCRPKSLTWWSSIGAIAVGVLGMTCPECDFGELSRLAAMLHGGTDTSPASLIFLGMVGVGLNDKFERVDQ